MRFELQFKVYRDLNIINNHIEIVNQPYLIKLFKESNQFYISISKRIEAGSNCLPILTNFNQADESILPEESSYSEMIEFINHIESFGAVDNKIEYIDKINIEFKWIPENDDDHFSPFSVIKRNLKNEQTLETISQDWLFSTVIHKRQLGPLYITFSFYRDAKQMFYSAKYQTAFCTFYMMLEYFFHEKNRGWGINNNAYKNNTCLQSCLIKTLHQIRSYSDHSQWLNNELQSRNKFYDEEGLLSLINSFRNDFSHASDKNKSRNIFNEQKYFSLAFIILVLCKFVTIKKRLSPFVNPAEVNDFYKK